MTLSQRLVLTVLASIGLAIVGAAIAMGLLARNALIGQAEDRGRMIAGLIAAEANRSDDLLVEFDAAALSRVEAQAIAIAHLAELYTPEELASAFAEITAASTIEDVWLLDGSGNPISRGVGGFGDEGVSITDLDAAGIDRRELEQLFAGHRIAIALQSNPINDFERALRYIAVRLRTDLFVLVGSAVNEAGIFDLAAGLTETLVRERDIGAIWVVDDQLKITAAAATGDRGQPALLAQDKALAERALNTAAADRASDRAAFSIIGGDALHVAAPILDRGSVVTGVVVMHLPRDRLDRLLLDLIVFGVIAAGLAFAAGSLIAIVSARRIARPVVALTRAAEQMDRGSFDPASLDTVTDRRDELGTLVDVFQSMAREVQNREQRLEAQVRARTADLVRKNEQLEAARQRVAEELGIARSLQSAILPRTIPEHDAYTGRALMVPAQELGGDFYDCFVLSDGRLGIVMADVSGKGVPAAFFMAIARTVTRSAAQEHGMAGRCLREVNDAICAQNPHDLFVTMFYGILDPVSGRFDYANAGHNAPFLVHADGGVEELPSIGGIVVGVMPDFDYEERSVVLAPGDTLFLYTDGISEAMNRKGDTFDEERLEHVLAEGPEEPIGTVIDNVTNALDAFVGDAPQSDDITCLALRYLTAKAHTDEARKSPS